MCNIVGSFSFGAHKQSPSWKNFCASMNMGKSFCNECCIWEFQLKGNVKCRPYLLLSVISCICEVINISGSCIMNENYLCLNNMFDREKIISETMPKYFEPR